MSRCALLAVLSTALVTCWLSTPVVDAQSSPNQPTDASASAGQVKDGGLVDGKPFDGRLFDPGVTRTSAAESAPPALAAMAPWLGIWDLELEIRRPGQDPLRSTGRAIFTYMNRGHAVMERTRISDFDDQGHDLATLAFLSVDKQGAWSASEGNSWTETISLMSGSFVDQRLVVHDTKRPGGGPSLVDIRRTYRLISDNQALVQDEMSRDRGVTWEVNTTRRYRRHLSSQAETFFPVRADTGLPSPDRPPEAGEFDFLVGEFDATHRMSTANGELSWDSHGTGVYVLDGLGILEFDQHDNDPSLPDSATSILRLYNRAMRRWESLYLTNRNHQPLYFGGVREDERIVLHPFDAQTAGNPLSQWIFYDMQPDAYRWKGLRSTDRGATYELQWGIDFKRKAATASKITPAKKVDLSADN